MSVIYSYDSTYYSKALHLRILDNVLSNASDYLLEPIFDPFEVLYDSPYTEKVIYTYENGTVSKGCFYVNNNASSDGKLLRGLGSISIVRYTYIVGQTTPIRTYMNIGSGSFPDSVNGNTYSNLNISTNIPIFETQQQAQDYIDGISDGSDAINYGEGGATFTKDTKDYYVYNTYQDVTIEKGIIKDVEDVSHQSNERILYTGRDICLYRTNDIFSLSLKMGNNLVGSYYSNTSSIANVPYSSFSTELEYSGLFYSEYNRKFEVYDYTGNIGLGLATNLPIWSNEQDANDYIAGNKDISECENWSKISNDKNYDDIIKNNTEEPETQTNFGEVFTRSFFSQMYLCNTSVLYKLSNDFFTYDPSVSPSSIWDKIKKGIEQYGTNPMEVIQGLRYYPIDLSSVFTQTQDNTSIWIGAYELDLEGPIAKRVIYPNGYKDLGSMKIERTFKDWRDFEPYTKLSIYLPYVGRYQLDLKKYYDKNVNIRYYIDLRTGSCCACLIADGILLDWFDGLIGTEMPITLTDYSTYAQNQINIIMRNAGVGVAAEGVVGNLGAKALTSANNYNNNAEMIQEAARMNPLNSSLAAQNAGAYGTQAFVAAGAATGAMIGGVVVGTTMKTHFDLARNGIAGYTKSRPGSSSMINQFLPQYPTFMFEIQEIDESEYLNELYGRPCNTSGTIANFSGYLEAEDVMLICPIATDNERQEIIDLVKSGIYI